MTGENEDCDCKKLRRELEDLRTEVKLLRRAVKQIADIVNTWQMTRYPGMGDRIDI